MGLEILAGGALLGGLSGMASGLAGTPDQRSSSSSTSTQKTTFDPASAEERALQQHSLQNYLQQMALGNQFEQGIGGAQGLQDQARQQYGNVLSGNAFNLTGQEQQNLMSLRNGMVDQSSADINRLLDSRLSQLSAGAADRGVRGQAFTQLQGDALRGATQEMGNATRQANQMYAQQAINLPYQRLAAQNPYIQGGANFAEQLRQQAMQNRQAMQSPFLLQMLNNERMRSGTTTTNSTSNTTQLGQEGNWWDALAGFMGGAGSMAKSGLGIYSSGKSAGFWGGPKTAPAPQQDPGYTSASNGYYGTSVLG